MFERKTLRQRSVAKNVWEEKIEARNVARIEAKGRSYYYFY